MDPSAGTGDDQRPLLMQLGLRRGLAEGIEIAVLGFLPGALSGFQITALIFFLNPHLEFSATPVIRGCFVYGSILGGVSLALHLPLTWARLVRARRALPWGLTVALGLAAASDWAHASLYAYYLPPGINLRLLKAAVLLSVAALIGFYTALAHRPQGRPYGWRSRLLYAFLTFGSIYVVLERRDAFSETLSPIEPRPTTVDKRQRPLLLVVGLEGATLDAILPLVERGRLPFFAKMLKDGAHGRLTPLNPPLRATLWTTLGTGKYPYQHGIVSREVFNAGFLTPGATFSLLPVGVDFTDWGTFGPSRPLMPPTNARSTSGTCCFAWGCQQPSSAGLSPSQRLYRQLF
ncbi:MAG: alkaline phosphatase family protein [Thermoanaerobaculia bacterium]|nr:alkaline phosphatase family protein [Thermoanaerobaculia bacterium]